MSKNLSTFLRTGNNAAPLPVSVGGTGVTTLTGLVKGTGAVALTAAVAGTDYQAPIGTISGLVKGNGANALTLAVAGTDYVAPTGSVANLTGGASNRIHYQTAASTSNFIAAPTAASYLYFDGTSFSWITNVLSSTSAQSKLYFLTNK
jgi:hypothetical protein